MGYGHRKKKTPEVSKKRNFHRNLLKTGTPKGSVGIRARNPHDESIGRRVFFTKNFRPDGLGCSHKNQRFHE